MDIQVFEPKILDFETEEQLYSYAESFVIDQIFSEISTEGTARLALAGGNTPKQLYSILGKNHSLPWEEVEIYQTDERFVPPSSLESNQKMIRDCFGEEVIHRLKTVNFIRTDLTTDVSISHYSDIISSLDDPLFDLVILGIGNDGHFASLFAEGNYLKHLDQPVISTKAPSSYLTTNRISLSAETLLNSKKILVLLKGESKKEVLTDLLISQKSVKDFPAKLLLSHNNLTIFTSCGDGQK